MRPTLRTAGMHRSDTHTGRPAAIPCRGPGRALPLWFALIAYAAGAAAELSPDERARLERGEVLVAVQDVTAARAVVLIAAPPAEVWTHIDHCADYDAFLPRVTQAEELAREGDEVTCKVVIGLPFPLPSLWSVSVARHSTEGDGRYRRDWRTVDGSYEVDEGSWTLSPYGGSGDRTLLEYAFRVVPRTSLVPAAIRRAAQRQTLPQVMEAVRARVRAEGIRNEAASGPVSHRD